MVKMKIFQVYMERQAIKAQTRSRYVSKAEREEMMKSKKIAELTDCDIDKGVDELMKLCENKYTWWEKLLLPFSRLWARFEEKCIDFKFRCQCFRRGYSDSDVWEMRDWFIWTAKPMLRELSTKAYNYPAEVGEDQWRALLLEMADLLEVMDIWDDGAARKAAGVAQNDGSEEAYRLINAEKEKAKNRFFFLFNKYFYDLWY